MSDFTFEPLRVDIAEISGGHSIKLNGQEFATNTERGSLHVSHDHKRNLALVTVTFVADELHWKGGLA